MTVSYNFAVATVALCVSFFWFGSLLRIKLPEWYLSENAIAAGRFAAVPLMLVTALVMAVMLFSARFAFDEKQGLVESMAGASLQLDRALTYFGTAQALKAKAEFNEYLKYQIEHPDTILKGVDRQKVEPFARDIQALQIPKGDSGVASLTKAFMSELVGKISLARFELATKTSRVIYPATMTMLIVWLCVLFAFIGVTSPPLNAPAFWFACVVAVCTGSISFLITEYQYGTSGLIQLDLSPFSMVLREVDIPAK